MRLLIERGDADIDAKDSGGRTPLSWAAGKGYEAVVRLLIDRGGVNIDAKDNSGMTPLSWAAVQRHEAILALMKDQRDILTRGSDIVLPSSFPGGTADIQVEVAGYTSTPNCEEGVGDVSLR